MWAYQSILTTWDKMTLRFKRRFLSRFKFVVVALLVLYLLVYYLSFGDLFHPAASKYIGKVSHILRSHLMLTTSKLSTSGERAATRLMNTRQRSIKSGRSALALLQKFQFQLKAMGGTARLMERDRLSL